MDSGSSVRKPPVNEQDIQRMLRIKDFYELLGVSKTATEDEIKKQYKKLALRFHPDKARMPGAQDVFKKIAQAYDCLTDADKRAFYDRTGSDEPQHQQQQYQQRYYQENFDPNDIFNMFFGGGFAQQQSQFHQRTYYSNGQSRHSQSQQSNHSQKSNSMMGMLQFLPLLLIVFSGMFSGMFAESQEFSLNKSSSFSILRKSEFLKVNYFVDDSFYDKVMEDVHFLQNFEWKVESNYVNTLKNTCYSQQNKQRQYANQARMAWTKGDQNYYQRLSTSVDMTQCNELDDYVKRLDINRYF